MASLFIFLGIVVVLTGLFFLPVDIVIEDEAEQEMES